MSQMGLETRLKVGIPIGKLEVCVDGITEELRVSMKKNGQTLYSINKNPNSRLSNETDIANLDYKNLLDLEKHVNEQAKKIYYVPWNKFILKQPRIKINFIRDESTKVAREKFYENKLAAKNHYQKK